MSTEWCRGFGAAPWECRYFSLSPVLFVGAQASRVSVYLSAFTFLSVVFGDQMSSSDSVSTATENASRLGYKHVCVNYLHVASHDYQYQEVIQHTHTHTYTHTHTRSLIHRIVLFFSRSTPTSLSTRIQVENESSKYYWIKNKSQAYQNCLSGDRIS